jgi:hypothetical protein
MPATVEVRCIEEVCGWALIHLTDQATVQFVAQLHVDTRKVSTIVHVLEHRVKASTNWPHIHTHKHSGWA